MDINAIRIVQVISALNADAVVIDHSNDPTIFSIGALNPDLNKNLIAYTLRISFTKAGGCNNLLLQGQALTVSDAFARNEPIPGTASGIRPKMIREIITKDFYKRNPIDLPRVEKLELANQKRREVQFADSVDTGKVAIREFLFTGIFEYEE